MPASATETVSGPRVVSPPTRRPRGVGKRVDPRGKPGEPVLVRRRQREAEQRPGRLGAHGREVGEVHRERAVADEARVEAGREMRAIDQRVEREDQRAARGRGDAAHASSPTPARTSLAPCAAPREEAFDQLEFAGRQGHGRFAAFGAAMRTRGAVEHGIHEVVAVGRAEALGELDALVDHHPVRNLRAGHAVPTARARGSRARPDRVARGLDVRMPGEVRIECRR